MSLSLKRLSYKKYGIEFISIFIAVVAAFALNNWNDNRREQKAAEKILVEIRNGLRQDVIDLEGNALGHRYGIAACHYWIKAINGEEVAMDSVVSLYGFLTRDFVIIQNSSGYETLKSRGLELIADDSLRKSIISLYEFDYAIMRKMEEEYAEMQFHSSYFPEINGHLSPYLIFNEKGQLSTFKPPINLAQNDKQIVMSYLWKIENNRKYLLQYYEAVVKKLEATLKLLEENID